MPRPLKPRPQNPLMDILDRKSKQSTAYHKSAKLEKKLAEKVGGYRTAGSGNKKEKGDVRKMSVTRIEHKATQKKSFSVTREMLEKIELAGRGCDEIPILVVEFLDDRGVSVGQLACLPFHDLTDMIDELSARKSDS